MGRPVAPVSEVNRRQRGIHPRPNARGRYASVLEPKGDVIPGAAHDQLRLDILEEQSGPVARRTRVEPVNE